MLLNLHVKNFALIDEADLDFREGLNVLTGETGAGKSILIDSVNAALGGRVRSDVIRKGADFAYIELVFSVDGEEKKEALRRMDISTEYDCILISRKIMPSRSIHKINDESVTSAKVRKVTELLLDIHGQHEHQSLLHKQKHLEILDQFASGENAGLRQQVADLYREYREQQEKLASYDVDQEFRRREMDFLAYEIGEIEEAGIRDGEREELEEVCRKYGHAKQLTEMLGRILTELGDSENEGAEEAVSRASRDLHEAAGLDPALAGYCEPLETAADLLRTTHRELVDYLEDLSYDPEELRQMEQRLDLIHRLEAKYGTGTEAIALALEERKEKYLEWEEYEERKAATEKALKTCEERLGAASEALSACRRAASEGLAASIRPGLIDLNFLHVEFEIHMEKLPEFTRQGVDSVEFMISTNPGESVRPLGQVASGGELSRIMLAIKAVLSDKDRIPTLIFDEIDTGISGRTAQKVSEKLRVIARDHQVICITHLPQIAAMADYHFCIEKSSVGDKTSTNVRQLDEREQIAELARLLGGAEITKTVYQNAAEMKELARKAKGRNR